MINMLEASQALVRRLADEDLVVAGLGNPKFNLFQAQDRPRNFYLWNAMGMASSIGLGLAMAQPERRVVILQGDGSLLMNLNSLASEAWRAPRNLIHICWDNRMFELTGKQPTATAGPTDLARLAEGAGFTHVERVETLAAFEAAVERAFAGGEGPWFIHALVDSERAKPIPPPASPTFIRHRFMTDLGVEP
jgi:thiamine pyrophosphate-dependent acetolactate synthase large subunit-like protein